LPPANQGTLFLGNPAQGGVAVSLGQGLTPAQISQLFFQSASGFSSATFTYNAVDNQGAIGSTPGVVTLNATTNNSAPIVNNATVAIAPGSAGNLTGLSATDTDGSIASYILSSLPPTGQGTLFLGNPAQGGTSVVVGQVLTPAQISQLFFRSAAGFSSATFTYNAIDNQGAIGSRPGIVQLNATTISPVPPVIPPSTTPAVPSPRVGHVCPEPIA
jgi:hypothetical protein